MCHNLKPITANRVIGAIILAGGNSSRISRNKALLHLGDKPIIEIIIAKLSAVFQKIVIVTNSPAEYEHICSRYMQIKLIGDIIMGRGPLGGIYSGLSYSDKEYNFVVACDMPFLDVNLIRYMVKHINGYDVVIPRSNGFIEPLHAIYSRSCLPVINAQLDLNNLSLRSILKTVRVKFIEQAEIDEFVPSEKAFFNINNNKELEMACAINDRESIPCNLEHTTNDGLIIGKR